MALASFHDRCVVRSPAPMRFADPDWRSDRSLYDGVHDDSGLRPFGRIVEQQRRIGALIRIGDGDGRLDAYQARRASFDLQSIRVQALRELDASRADDENRRAVQSRLDRLEAGLRAALSLDRRSDG